MITLEQLQMYPMGSENRLIINLLTTNPVMCKLSGIGHDFDGNPHFAVNSDQAPQYPLRMCKPHLRSLPQLTEPITHNGKTFVPIDVLWETFGDTYDFEIMNDGEVLPTEFSFEICKLLLSWHFNVFNLDKSQYIEKK